MPAFRTMDEIEVSGKRVVIRVDLNVPIEDGKVRDETRITRIAPTIRELSDKGAAVIVLAHFDRPKGKVVPDMSLGPVTPALARAIGKPVIFVPTDWKDGAALKAAKALKPGFVALMENTRFAAGEEKNDPAFARDLAALGDIYVNDAFSAAHRAHASTEGIARLIPAVAGRAMEAELKALGLALEHPKRPVAAIVGGAKISTKLDLLGNLTAKVDMLIIGGGMANTFLAAKGQPVGTSLCERDLLDTARAIMAGAAAKGCTIVLPDDVIVAGAFKAHAACRDIPVSAVGDEDMILDIGRKSQQKVIDLLKTAATLVWNGPFGAFELPPFDQGTIAIAREAASLTRQGRLISVAGGGDTVAALNHAGVADDFTYVSTAGGAFLEWLEGKDLPGVKVLEQ